jgi:hypothetical protein
VFARPINVLMLCLLAQSAWGQDVLVAHYEVLRQCGRDLFNQSQLGALNSAFGKDLVSKGAALAGVDPAAVEIGVRQIPAEHANDRGQDTYPLVRSPVGYTVCAASPSNPNMGAGQAGIETHGDTTFNATILRVIPGITHDDGLAMYLVVPCKRSTDTRVQASFDVTFVRAEPGWQDRFKCSATGSHPWLARNNSTSLNVPCSTEAYCQHNGPAQ